MASNAIIARRQQTDDGGKFDPAGLESYCQRMNAHNFVQANGWEYFVNTRTLHDGTRQRYVDRRDCHRSMPRRLVSEARAALAPPKEPPFGQWHPGHAD